MHTQVGETKLARRLELDACLAKKVGSVASPWTQLRIDYGALGATGRGKTPFSAENDRFLICMTHQVGYGRWEELQREARRSWLFRFDWYVKTRTQAELGRRVEMLAKLIEKEQETEAAAAAEAARKAKKAGKAAGGKRAAEEAAAPAAKKRRDA